MFTREAAIAPRRASFFAARSVFVAALFGLTLTAWQLLVGSQRLESIGDLAWFGAAAFQILAPFQLAVALPFSALLVASAVAIEKDRRTMPNVTVGAQTKPGPYPTGLSRTVETGSIDPDGSTTIIPWSRAKTVA